VTFLRIEAKAREALTQLDPLWDEPFPGRAGGDRADAGRAGGQRMLAKGEPARREKVDRRYKSRVLRFTLLAQEIVETILEEWQPKKMRMEDLLEGVPVEWAGQGRCLGGQAGD
jgi:hypothetical protein